VGRITLFNVKFWVTVVSQVLVKDLLRKYPQWSHDCIAVVGGVGKESVQEPKAKCALVWMLGEYSYDMPDAPYVLEEFVKGWTEEEAEVLSLTIVLFIRFSIYFVGLFSPSFESAFDVTPYQQVRDSIKVAAAVLRPLQVRLELLTATAKCFFKRPPETISTLGAALSSGIADANQVSKMTSSDDIIETTLTSRSFSSLPALGMICSRCGAIYNVGKSLCQTGCS
jgi:hypothetical protein